jgi:hypothetical protein
MSTPKTDLTEESTDAAGSTPESQPVVRSSDALAKGDASVRALGIDVSEAILPIPPPVQLDPGARERWRGVRSKSLPIKTVQSMARAARVLYRNVLDWSIGSAVPLLHAKPRRNPEK